MTAYIPAETVRIHGEYCGLLLIKRRRARIAELGGRIPEGLTLDDMRRLHAERRLRFVQTALSTEVLVTEPSARGRF
jgi:hypothetical protein